MGIKTLLVIGKDPAQPVQSGLRRKVFLGKRHLEILHLSLLDARLHNHSTYPLGIHENHPTAKFATCKETVQRWV